NAQGEYYLTDVVAMAVERGLPVQACIAADEAEVAGVNDRAQLARLERHYQHRLAEHWMRQGVSFADPGRVDFRGDVRFGRDVFVDVNVVFSGRVVVGDGVRIASNCVIEDSRIGDHTEILPNCVIDAAEIGGQARIGPFARVRPETVLGSGVHVGNFVEIKKSVVDDGSKINHLSYIGDAEIGARVNVGAGTITCNYDGANKYQTAIEDDVFVGSDTQLVAPVRIGRGATIGAGTTVTRDVGAEKLVVSRVSQREIDGWTRPRKRPPDSS
ncbi:MAG: bifunctional UDP-N-acetylglucosamine diphosphorylase/glucosamine-1-phosphate N-acetyltransferase GlmU, partial [Gammaproteobacteria bacterium]|nr:bifunctional UDP-N-acetylglucosamine diphosphorylase/glucosamine-1-phosphate N-acetyltransferase GlmU [Gammaproteobacteria bacterium]